jgi:hypothetical protein
MISEGAHKSLLWNSLCYGSDCKDELSSGRMLNCLSFYLDGGRYTFLYPLDAWHPDPPQFPLGSGMVHTVLIEYVADMHQMDLSTFSKSRLASLRAILREIHDAKICHGDVYPRNMMVVSGKPDRVLWIDFDSAQPSRRMNPSRQCNKDGWKWIF